MDRLPEEVVLHILAYLAVPDIVTLQAVSHRYLTLARDSTLWKIECFDRSQAESLRRRQQLRNAQDARLAELRNAVSALPGSDLTASADSRLREGATPDPAAEASSLRQRALANWEPGYPGERLDYYEEFVRRHAPIHVDYLTLPRAPGLDREAQTTATGVGVLQDHGIGSQHAVAPLDDGSICIWDLSARSTHASGGGGQLIAQSRRGLLSGQPPSALSESHALMTETGAVECVAIDNAAQRGYFAVQSLLHEVDLNTLQIASSKQYPWPITALSAAEPGTPVTVGTNMTIHLHDPRDAAYASTSSPSSSGELIGGSVYSHATLAQPGPLSILHHGGSSPDDSSIWVAGRFTSLLHYDRRFFPRLRGHIFSGARVACLASLHQPLTPTHATAAAATTTTLVAAAEYKGKGSLELYPLPPSSGQQEYKNRQTASASKLLAVAPHGGTLVFADGDGNLKWLERDARSFVRGFNINDAAALPPAQETVGLWSSAADEMPGRERDDIVQKILPLPHANTSSRADMSTPSRLLLWTGDGALGVLGHGHRGEEEGDWHDARESQVADAAARAHEDAERQYGRAMRRALERSADEVRFVRGLGMV